MNAGNMSNSDQKAQAELDFLAAIERGEVVTQMALKTRIGVSVGMVNALVKRAVSKGYAKVSQAPYKRYAYYLTPKGFTEKSRLVAEYLETSLDFFRQARSQYAALFARAKASGYQHVALAGQGELTEIALLAAMSEGVPIVGIVDPAAASDGRLGVPVVSSIDELNVVDIIVLCETRAPQLLYEELCKNWDKSKIMAPALLRITPDRKELITRAREDSGR